MVGNIIQYFDFDKYYLVLSEWVTFPDNGTSCLIKNGKGTETIYNQLIHFAAMMKVPSIQIAAIFSLGHLFKSRPFMAVKDESFALFDRIFNLNAGIVALHSRFN